jgi:ribose transport system permease protein
VKIIEKIRGKEPTSPREPTGFRTVATGLLTRSYLLVFLVLTMVVGTLVSPVFLTGRNLENIIVTGAVVSVLAIGQFMVIVTRGIDLSVGSVAALATVVVAILLQNGQPAPLAIALTLAACGFVGLINGLVVVYAGITPFIATLAMLSIARGVAFIVQVGTLIAISNEGFIDVFAGTALGIPSPVIIFLIVMLVAAFVMQFTTFGRQLYAIGGNPEAARLSGLPVNRNLTAVYVISGLLAGVTGLMLAAQLSQGSSLIGQGYELNSIAAAVVGGTSLFGGTGNPISAVIGGLIIGTISNIMNLVGIQSEPQLVILGVVILLAVFFTSGDGPRRLSRAVRRLTRSSGR